MAFTDKDVKQIGAFFAENEDVILSSDKYNSFYVVANRSQGIVLVDNSDKTNPKLISQIYVEGRTLSVHLLENDKFVLCGSIIKGDKLNPIVIQKYEIKGQSNSDYICLSENKKTAYVALHNAILILPLYKPSVQFNIDRILIQRGKKVLKKKVILDQSYIFSVGEVMKIQLIQIFPKKEVTISGVQYYNNFQMYDLPTWAVFSINDQYLQVQITSQGLDDSSDNIFSVQFVFQAKQILTKVDFMNQHINVNDQEALKKEQEKSLTIFQECRRRSIVDTADYVIVSSTEFIREVFSQYTEDDRNYILFILKKKIFYQPVEVQYKKSLTFSRDNRQQLQIGTISDIVKVTITIDQSDGKLLKILYPGVLSYYTEQEDELRVEGKIESINKIIQNGFRLANNTQPQNINLTMVIDDYLNNPLKINFPASDNQLIRINSPVLLNADYSLQQDFEDQYQEGTIYILQTFSYTINSAVFVDKDKDKIILSAQIEIDGEYQSIPESYWLSYQQEEGTFYGSTKVNQFGDVIKLKIIASDGYTNTFDYFSIRIQYIPIEYIIQLLAQILGPFFGALGLWKYKSAFWNCVKRKDYQSMTQQFSTNKEFIIQIPLLEDRLLIAQQVWKHYLKQIDKQAVINEFNLLKKVSSQLPLNQENISQLKIDNISFNINCTPHNFPLNQVPSQIITKQMIEINTKQMTENNETIEQFFTKRKQQSNQDEVQNPDNKQCLLQNSGSQSIKNLNHQILDMVVTDAKQISRQQNQYQFNSNQRDMTNSTAQQDYSHLDRSSMTEQSAIIRQDTKKNMSHRTKSIIQKYQKQKSVQVRQKKQSVFKHTNSSYFTQTGQLNIQYILSSVQQFCVQIENQFNLSQFMKELNSPTTKSSYCIIGLCSLMFSEWDVTTDSIVLYLKQIAIQQGYTEQEWYRKYVKIIPQPALVQYDPFPQIVLNEDEIRKQIDEFQSCLINNLKISTTQVNFYLPLIKQVIKAHKFGISVEKSKFLHKIRGESLEIFPHNILCLKTFRPLKQKQWICCGRLADVLIDKEFSQNTTIPSWMQQIDISNGTLLIQGKTSPKDIGEYVLKIYDKQCFVIKELNFIIKDNELFQEEVKKIIEQNQDENVSEAVIEESNLQLQYYHSKDTNRNCLNTVS